MYGAAQRFFGLRQAQVARFSTIHQCMKQSMKHNRKYLKKSTNPKIAIARPATNKKAKANFVALTCSFVT
jgi:hypothetical protein